MVHCSSLPTKFDRNAQALKNPTMHATLASSVRRSFSTFEIFVRAPHRSTTVSLKYAQPLQNSMHSAMPLFGLRNGINIGSDVEEGTSGPVVTLRTHQAHAFQVHSCISFRVVRVFRTLKISPGRLSSLVEKRGT